MKFSVICFFCICIILSSYSQVVLEPFLYNSVGNSVTIGSYQMSFSVGEPIIKTTSVNGVTFTQGFHQPQKRFSFLDISFHADSLVENTCLGLSTGVISILPSNGVAPYFVFWNDLPNDSITFTRDKLSLGTYVAIVRDSHNAFDTLNIAIVETDDCLRIYHGITPNGDGANDTWYLSNIEVFPENEIVLYSRWGNVVWETKGYNNSTNYWNGQDKNNNRLPDGTYFYVIQNAGPKVYKGWVELTSNR